MDDSSINYNNKGLEMADDSELRSMMKSELIELMARKQNHLAYKDVELAVKSLLEQMSESLATGERIEIRGFGSFSLHFRPPRAGRNPKTGDSVSLPGKYVPHFKPGKELRERVTHSLQNPE
jgi:integration host factor subunit beta